MADDLTLIENTADLWCQGDDFRADMPMVFGREALAQRLIRIITTRPGTLPFDDWDGRCIDVRDFLLSTATSADVERAVIRVLLLDEQVDSARVLATFTDDGATLNLEFLILDSEGPWTFSLTVSQAATSLRSLQAAG